MPFAFASARIWARLSGEKCFLVFRGLPAARFFAATLSLLGPKNCKYLKSSLVPEGTRGRIGKVPDIGAKCSRSRHGQPQRVEHVKPVLVPRPKPKSSACRPVR